VPIAGPALFGGWQMGWHTCLNASTRLQSYMHHAKLALAILSSADIDPICVCAGVPRHSFMYTHSLPLCTSIMQILFLHAVSDTKAHAHIHPCVFVFHKFCVTGRVMDVFSLILVCEVWWSLLCAQSNISDGSELFLLDTFDVRVWIVGLKSLTRGCLVAGTCSLVGPHYGP
jgi:hypothetical protein